MMTRPLLRMLLTVGWLVPSLANAHGDVNDHVHSLTHALEHDATTGAEQLSVRLERAKALYQLGQYDDALHDAQYVLRHDKHQLNNRYLLAQIFYVQKHFDESLQHARFFVEHAKHDAAKARGHNLLGDVYMAKNQPTAAVDAYLSSLNLKQQKQPADFLSVAAAYAQVDPPQFDQAISMLDQGLKESALNWMLINSAVEYEREKGDVAAALARLEAVEMHSQMPMALLIKQGDLYAQVDRQQAAADVFNDVINRVERLPAARQNSKAIHAIYQMALSKLASIAVND